MISMPLVRKRQNSRKVIAIILFTCMVMGCAPFSKTGLRDFKSYSFLPSKARVESDAPRSKPLSVSEQRKLCISTAEQLAKSQHWSESIKLYEKAESLGKSGQVLDRELAPAYAADGRYSESMERYKRLLAKNPNDAELEINYAWTLMESGNVELAEEHLRNVTVRKPNNQIATLNLATLLAKTGRTADSYETFLPILGESASHHNIGVILLDNGHEDMARVAFENATKCSDASTQSKQFFAALQSNDVRITQR